MRRYRYESQRTLIALIALALLAVSFTAPAARAGMITTRTLAAEQAGEAARERLQTMIEREDVQERLVALGVDPVAAEARVAALTDAEAEQLAARMDELPAGGADIVGAAVFIFVVLLVTDILGFTDVFPFVTSTAR
ncbi:PA2779 family protein [Arhodomonas sp. AD133]|uniref:PA2779 family protein n=1 Tax=Arhodomonas sp. AD133 TaxID=3415009 RepID=UPI003EB7D1C4